MMEPDADSLPPGEANGALRAEVRADAGGGSSAGAVRQRDDDDEEPSSSAAPARPDPFRIRRGSGGATSSASPPRSPSRTGSTAPAEGDVPSERQQQQQQQQQQREQQQQQERQRDADDVALLRQCWRTYDQILVLSVSSVLGIIVRVMSATWFRNRLGVVFSEDSALGTNLPLNAWSCFLMGLLCSGREAMGIVHSKVLGGANPYGSGRGILEVGRGVIDAGRAGIRRARGYGDVRSPEASANVGEGGETPGNSSPSNGGLTRRRRGDGSVALSPTPARLAAGEGRWSSPQNDANAEDIGRRQSDVSIAGLLGLDEEFRIAGSHKDSEDEVREVQLRGLSRRIAASPSLALFPARKVDVDIMEHYEGLRSDALSPLRRSSAPDDQFEIGDLDENEGDDMEPGHHELCERSPSGEASGEASGQREGRCAPSRLDLSLAAVQQPTPPDNEDGSNSDNVNRDISRSHSSIEEQVDEMIHNISENVTTLRRIHLLDGWNVDTSPEKMNHIILLGLRVGFCGALSTFSSLNASVIRLLRSGAVGEALVGYALSIQLGIVSYRMGQHLAVYIFVWRCRREARRDERRGYGLRLRSSLDADEEEPIRRPEPGGPARRRPSIPSVRTAVTLLFVAMFVTLCLAIRFFPKHQQYICSLLFTPFGCLARWKLMNQYNSKLPGFPLGTFSCNLLSCALSGSLGSFLAGNPAPEEKIVLTSLIAGFAGSLSTFATWIVEILALIDPIIFKFDGMVYAVITILWAVIIGALLSQAKNWADEL